MTSGLKDKLKMFASSCVDRGPLECGWSVQSSIAIQKWSSFATSVTEDGCFPLRNLSMHYVHCHILTLIPFALSV